MNSENKTNSKERAKIHLRQSYLEGKIENKNPFKANNSNQRRRRMMMTQPCRFFQLDDVYIHGSSPM